MARLNHFLIIAAIFAVCRPAGENVHQSEVSMQRASELQKAVVDSFAVVDSEKVGAVDILLAGQLPSPAYNIERVDVKRRGKVIEITPWMRYDPNKIVIMVTVPYSQRVSLGNLGEQTYTVRVVDAKQIRSRQVQNDVEHGIE
jgi:hypothetical protein